MGVLGKPGNGMTFLCTRAEPTSLIYVPKTAQTGGHCLLQDLQKNWKTTSQHVGQSSGEIVPIHYPPGNCHKD